VIHKYKIRHLSNNLILENGGPTYSISNLCLSLEQLGNNVKIYSIENRKGTHQNIFPFKLFKNNLNLKIGFSYDFILNLISDSRKGEIDLIHSHELWTLPNVVPFFSKKFYQLPWVLSPRGTFTKYSLESGSNLKRIYWPLIQKPSLKYVSAFHATSELEYEDIRRLGFKQPIAIIPNGIKIPSVFSKLDKKTVLYFGRLHKEKGLENLLKAWSLISKSFKEWNLKIVGPDMNYRSTLEAIIKKGEIKRVKIEGAKYGYEKEEIFLNSSIFVLPSFTENFGTVVAEALSYSIPTITNFGAPWQALVDKKCGWWIDPSIESLSKTLIQAIESSETNLLAMGQKGRQWMQKDFNWFDIAKKMTLFYNYIINKDKMPNFVYLE